MDSIIGEYRMQIEASDSAMRILDTLARLQSSPISINELTKEIKAQYGKGDYPIIYNKVHSLEKEKND